jgi:hypothetical protein
MYKVSTYLHGNRRAKEKEKKVLRTGKRKKGKEEDRESEKLGKGQIVLDPRCPTANVHVHHLSAYVSRAEYSNCTCKLVSSGYHLQWLEPSAAGDAGRNVKEPERLPQDKKFIL